MNLEDKYSLIVEDTRSKLAGIDQLAKFVDRCIQLPWKARKHRNTIFTGFSFATDTDNASITTLPTDSLKFPGRENFPATYKLLNDPNGLIVVTYLTDPELLLDLSCECTETGRWDDIIAVRYILNIYAINNDLRVSIHDIPEVEEYLENLNKRSEYC